MTAPRLAAILHGARWPAGDAGAAWRERLSRALQREVEIVLARDEASSPRGAAACIMQGIARTLAPHVIVADIHATPDDHTLRTLVQGLGSAALVVPSGSGLASAQAPHPSADAAATFRTHLREAAAVDAAADPPRRDPLVWAVDRERLLDAGGLDETLWSLGAVDDLAARLARLDADVSRVVLPDIVATGESYPYTPSFATFLSWRNRLRTAFVTASPEHLGETLCLSLVSLLAEAWASTGLDARRVSFGGDWGRASLASRLRTRLGGPPPDALWPKDEVGAAVRLAALQAFAQELPGLTRLRESRGLGRAPHVAFPTAPGPVDTGVPIARPRVSVIVVNWNGREHLEDCFSSLLASEYPASLLELICVDNGSTDDSRDLLATRFPSVRVVALDENLGFTGGNAAGVAAAAGDVFVFVNNDMKFEPSLISRLVDGLDAHTACVGARVMSWDGTSIDFVRGTASFEARGFQEQFGQAYAPGMALAESFFPNGGAFAVTRRAYVESGGFDPALFAYYDDVDLGWRLRMAGHGIRTAADAVAYHRHGATVGTQPHAHKRFMLARNALWIAIRNYDDRTLPSVLPAILMLAGLRVAQDLVWLRSPLRDLLRPWLEPTRRHVVGAGVYAFGCLRIRPCRTSRPGTNRDARIRGHRRHPAGPAAPAAPARRAAATSPGAR